MSPFVSEKRRLDACVSLGVGLDVGLAAGVSSSLLMVIASAGLATVATAVNVMAT